MSYANRGMRFEELVIYACQQYERKGIANIKKVSTPWKVVRDRKRIVSAFPEGPSTVDFMGDYEGRSICFETKSTESSTSIPFSNFEEHQIEFIRRWKGISFALIHFEPFDETYLISKEHLLQWWDAQYTGGRKSIPYDWFKENAKPIKSGSYALDYLAAVN